MMNLRKLGLSVSPKTHSFEYHAIESIQDLNGLGDKTEYFIELSHQDGVCHDRRTQDFR